MNLSEIDYHDEPPSGTPLDAPPLLLVHGAWNGAWCWEGLAAHLRALGLRTIRFSLPGHGANPCEKSSVNGYGLADYVSFVEAIVDRIDRAPILVGHSMGGAIVQKLFERRSLPGAVLLASAPSGGSAWVFARLSARYPFATLKTLLRLDGSELMRDRDRARRLLISDSNPMDFDALHARLGPESLRVLLGLTLPWALSPSRITGTPLLVVAAGADRFFSMGEQRRTARNLGADLLVMEGQAHHLVVEPGVDVLAERISMWIRETVAEES